MWWCEVRQWQKRVGAPYFVKLDELAGKQGFRSVYAYDEGTVCLVRERGSAANIGDREVYSDKLFLDFDDVGCADTIEMLCDLRVAFSVWTSGNRSFHIHVQLVPMVGQDVPYSQKHWVQHKVPDKADLTFYHAAGQFRLPGTLHEKTKQRKLKIETYEGEPLELPRAARVIPTSQLQASRESGVFMARILRRQNEPGRRVFAWHLAKTAHEEGVPYDEALTSILWWNEHRCSPPLPPNLVEDRVLQVYCRECK